MKTFHLPSNSRSIFSHIRKRHSCEWLSVHSKGFIFPHVYSISSPTNWSTLECLEKCLEDAKCQTEACITGYLISQIKSFDSLISATDHVIHPTELLL